MRNLAIVVSALAALAAQAQQTQDAAPAASANASVRESAERPVMLADAPGIPKREVAPFPPASELHPGYMLVNPLAALMVEVAM